MESKTAGDIPTETQYGILTFPVRTFLLRVFMEPLAKGNPPATRMYNNTPMDQISAFMPSYELPARICKQLNLCETYLITIQVLHREGIRTTYSEVDRRFEMLKTRNLKERLLGYGN